MTGISRLRAPIIGLALIVSISLLAAGCTTVRFEAPTRSFQASVAKSSAAIASWYGGLNQLEREIYLDEVLRDPARTLDAYDANGRPTPLIEPTFSPASIQARLDALALLGAYADHVYALATGDPATELGGAIDDLGGSLTGLSDRFASFGGADARAGAYVQPIGQVVKAIGAIWMEAEKEERLRSALDQGDGAVKKVLELLETDLRTVVDPLQRTGLAQLLATRVQWYNDHRDAPLAERQAMLADIQALTTRYDAAMAADPAATIRAMRSAHAALVALAHQPDAPTNKANLAARLAVFTSTAEQLGAAVKGLIDAGASR